MTEGPHRESSPPEHRQVRRFTSTSGREWTVEVFEVPQGVAVRSATGVVTNAVLRFTASDVTLDLPNVPHDWYDCDEQSLMELLRLANVPGFVRLGSESSDEHPLM
jgi:hypothetical protein